MTKENQLIYNTLSREIITMQIKPGTMLKEIDIATRFNVSRTPIRDVFKKLENEHLLVILSQKGSYVSKINLEGITDIMYIRDQVENSILNELINIITPGDIVKLRMIVNDQLSLLSHYNEDSEHHEILSQKFFDLDNIFHDTIFRRVGKESILVLLNSIDPSFSRYRFLTFLRDQKEIAKLCELHGKIVDCLEKKNFTELSQVVKEHNFSGLNGMETVRSRHPDYFA